MAERLNRDKVVATAADLADDVGFYEVSITKLGRALGIAPPGVYRHVADLDDLRRAISIHAAREAGALLSAACAGRSGFESLSALATALRQWAGAHPGRYAALQISPEPADTEGQAAAESILDVIGAALRAYHLQGEELTDAIRIVRSALHGFISLENNGGFKQARSIDATFQRMIASLDAMLKPAGHR